MKSEKTKLFRCEGQWVNSMQREYVRPHGSQGGCQHYREHGHLYKIDNHGAKISRMGTDEFDHNHVISIEQTQSCNA